MIVKAPNDFSDTPAPRVFLAGSIEMGSAPDWQEGVSDELSKAGMVVLSPRRDDWDASAEQSIDNDYFREQVEWELLGLETADTALMYFVPGTKSPICLLELGLFARSGKLVVCCPKGFWRKGNVDIVCQRYGVMQASSLEASVLALKAMLKEND